MRAWTGVDRDLPRCSRSRPHSPMRYDSLDQRALGVATQSDSIRYID